MAGPQQGNSQKQNDMVKVCITRVADGWATQGICLERIKSRRKAGKDDDGNQLWTVRTTKKVLLTKSYREVTRSHANQLMKLGLVQEYNPDVHEGYVDGDAVKYNPALSGTGPARTENYQRGEVDEGDEELLA